jgi:hypothetical protein
MDMPVDMMHGVFVNFLIPGIILFGLGIINTVAFISVLRRSRTDWFMSGLALGGLLIWFVVEIIIIQELHWLHLMWGSPVFLGFVVAIPLFVSNRRSAIAAKTLLFCGILSSLWYAVINIIAPLYWNGYSVADQTVSELSAFGAPTRIMWVLLVIFYPFLFSAFGWGIRQIAGESQSLKTMGGLIVVYSVFNFYWPPMHLREVIAAGGGTLSDKLHIVWAMITLILMMALMGFGAAGMKKSFRLYTMGTWIVFVLCGIMTFLNASKMEANLPTPWMGIWERINIGAFMLWVVVFAIVIWKRTEEEQFKT